jgi:hypothetical protein
VPGDDGHLCLRLFQLIRLRYVPIANKKMFDFDIVVDLYGKQCIILR